MLLRSVSYEQDEMKARVVKVVVKVEERMRVMRNKSLSIMGCSWLVI